MSDVWFFGTLVTVGGNVPKERTSSVVLDSSLCVESRMKVTDDESLSLPRVDWITNELILCDPDPVNPWQSFVAVQRSGRG